MSKRVLILVEGQTEERFVKDVLSPAFEPRDLYITPTILKTKIVKDGPNFKGGISSFAKFEIDLSALLRGSGGRVVTTLVDYYKLPKDFPGMNNRPIGSALARATHVELALWSHFGSAPNLWPFLALHEFEAWLFSCPNTLPRLMTNRGQANAFAAVCTGSTPPEEINEDVATSPSHRIMGWFPEYQKPLHGPTAVARMGLGLVRSRCTHFDSWIRRFEAHAGA